MDNLIRKDKISEELGVSLATIDNWIKTQVIPAPDVQIYYNQNTYDLIINTVKNDQMRLNSRANRSLLEKKTLCYLGITNKERKQLLLNLVNDFKKSNLTIDEGVLAVSLAILRSNKLIDADWQPNINSRLGILLSDMIKKINNPQAVKSFYDKYEIPNFDDDILGAFYQSIQSISQKSNSGSYYTPSKLLSDIKIPFNKTILDPCCGSGGILLNILSKEHDTSKIFARDTDETALNICFINLVLFFNNSSIAPNISKHDITVKDINDLFSHSIDDQFDYIVTNPPWGSKFSVQQKKNLIKLYPELETSEIFSIALYNAGKMLRKNGELYFFLPHSFLNVAAHKNIRRFIFTDNNRINIKLLGNAFTGVLSESILLHLTNSAGSSAPSKFAVSTQKENISIQDKDRNIYQIPLNEISLPNFIISVSGNEMDRLLIEKIYNTEHVTLKDGTIFALGIVTGNNKKYLKSEKKRFLKAIYRGKDIEKYTLLEPSCYIEYKPEIFQQTAPEEYYKREKIVYRFICDKLICALDTGGNFFLNSANFFIPADYPIHTVVSFFNSEIYTFIFRRKFQSKKVLKSHLQDLPLPVLPKETHSFINILYNETFSKKNTDVKLYQEKIDIVLCKTFGIEKDEYNYLKNQTEAKRHKVII